MTLDEIADELYALAPELFTAARDGFAREVQSAGDRELAEGVRRLRRPTRAAWLVNLLARERAPELAKLLALGDALRAEQAGAVRGDGAGALRTLGERRRTAIDDLVATASRLAQTQTVEPTAAVLAEVSGTLEAATADANIGAAIGAGQLIAAISYAGFGELPDLAMVTATPALPAQPGQTARKRATTGEQLAQAQQDARDAAGLADDAQRGYERAEADLARAGAAVELAAALEETLRAQLTAATGDRRSAQASVQGAQEAVRAAAQRARAAHRAADAARRALAKATDAAG